MLKELSINLLGFYQGYIRVLLPSSCRFVPTCSEYAKEAIAKYGFLRGLYKAGKRLLHCHPLSSWSGYDPLQ
ncbi:MAG: membrane protein insertion efficiency factor YidD [Candidatus Omnitrophota bacterium]